MNKVTAHLELPKTVPVYACYTGVAGLDSGPESEYAINKYIIK